MNQTEVVAPEVQRNSSFQIGQFPREGQGETVKSSNLHSQRQILPFDVGRTVPSACPVEEFDSTRHLFSR